MKLPEALLQSLEGVTGYNEHDFVQAHTLVDAPVSIRLNSFKPAPISFPEDGNVPWCSNGRYLSSRPSFITDPLWHAGAYYVQEASSMFLEQVLTQCADVTKDLRVLDLCAAPGGKSTLVQNLITPGSLLVCNEVIKQRLSVLEENITRWGAANIVVTGSAPADFARLEHFFDVMITDVPCSGSGLFRKDPAAVEEWSPEQVKHCSLRQQQILQEALPALKPGGLIIYATCSYSAEENEQVLDVLVKAGYTSLKVNTSNSWNIVETKADSGATGYRFYPDRVRGEGFFIAAFRKPEEGRTHSYTPEKIPKVAADVIRQMQAYVSVQSLDIVKFKDTYLGFHAGLAGYLPWLQKHLYIRKAGVCLGMPSRTDWIPDHELACSKLISPSVPAINLQQEDALQYLRGQSVHVETDLRGWVLACYQSLPMGWMKVLSNRMNNYYPRHWRIINK